MTKSSRPSRPLLLLGTVAAFVLALSFLFGVYRPDRPVATIAPGSSSGPSFVVQIIRPRLGLPLGGLLPPQLFRQDAHLGFASTSAGAAVGSVGPGRIELAAGGWNLVLVNDASGRVTAETEVVFEFMFEDRLRRVRCRPGDPVVGELTMTSPAGPGELSGNFDIELAHCEDAGTGESLGWPPGPLVLHGSFDRLALGSPGEPPFAELGVPVCPVPP